SLVSGTGGADNASFTIDTAGHLKTAASFDYEARSSYSVRVRSTDSGGLSTEEVFLVSVTDVNDAPAGTDRSVTTAQDTDLVFTAADSGSSAPQDDPSTAFLAVKLTTLPSAGTLTVNGAAATAGQVVTAADVAAGELVYSPPAGATGTPAATFTFQVQDDGG